MNGGKVVWRSHPLVDEFPRSALLPAAILGASCAVALAFEGLGYGLVAAAVLAASLGRYLLPTRYELREDGAVVWFLGRGRLVPWGEVKRVEVGHEGVFLSPFARRSRLDSFRGTFLRFNGNRDEVLGFVHEKVAAAQGGASPRLRP